MGRYTWVPFAGNVANADGDVDLITVRPGDDKPVKCRGFLIGQTSEAKDADEFVMDLRLVRMTATITNGTGGAAGAPIWPAETDSAVAVGYTSRTMDTAVATTTGATRELSFPWQIRNVPYMELFPDGGTLPPVVVKETEGLFLRCATAVPSTAGTVAVRGWVLVEEEG